MYVMHFDHIYPFFALSVGVTKVLVSTEHQGTKNVKHTGASPQGETIWFPSRRLGVDIVCNLVTFLLSEGAYLTRIPQNVYPRLFLLDHYFSSQLMEAIFRGEGGVTCTAQPAELYATSQRPHQVLGFLVIETTLVVIHMYFVMEFLSSHTFSFNAHPEME